MFTLRKMNGKKRLAGIAGIAVACAAGLMAACPAHADTIDWATWTSATPGTPDGSASATLANSPITVSYTGEVESLQANYPSWTPVSSYVGGVVGNAPPQSGGIIQLFGGAYGALDTITFSAPVTDPILAIWSLGAAGNTAEYDFNEPVTIQAGGPSAEYGGMTITQDGNDVYGTEGNGTLEIEGTYSSISWTTPVFENWYGFTVGVDAATVPLPSSLPMVAVGMLGLIAWRGLKSVKARRTA